MTDESSSNEASSRALGLGLTLAAILLAALALWPIQSATPGLVDDDSYYHARAANVLVRYGDNLLMKRQFPWMQATFLRDHYADKEFLFHVVLAPFVLDEATLVQGAKLATVALGTLVFVAFALAVHGARIRNAWLWTLLLLASGEHFLFRLSMTRPHLLSIALVLLGVRFVLERRWLATYFVSYLLAWSYSGPELLPALAILAALGRWSRDRTLVWQPAAASIVGVACGLLLHPFVVNSLYVFEVQNVEVVLRAFGLKPSLAALGPELGPTSTRSLLVDSPGMVLALVLGIGSLVAAKRRPSVRTAQLAAMAGGAFLLYLGAAKFVEYAAPLAVLFAASAVDDQRGARLSRRSWVAPLLGLAFLALAATGSDRARAIAASIPVPRLQKAARWLGLHARGQVVAHFDWNDFSTLFFFNPESYYLFGLDPTFMEVWYPDALAKLEKMRSGRAVLEPSFFRAQFGASWLVVPKYRSREVRACFDSGMDPAFEDDDAVIFGLPE